DHAGGNVLGRTAGVGGGDDVAVGVHELERRVEGGAELGDVDGEVHRAVERVEGEDVDVAGLFDDARAGGVCAGDVERIGDADGVAVIVGAIAEAVGRAGDDRHVVLGNVVTEGRLAIGPLAAGGVVADAHDRGDERVALAVFVGLGGAAVLALVLEAKAV